MGIGDVVAQKKGVSLSDVAAAADGAEDTKPEGASGPAPSISFAIGGEETTLSAQTLTLYGVALADLLLLYIAWRV